MEGERSKTQGVQMCEDIAGCYQRGPPFYFITRRQTSLASQPDQRRSCRPRERLLSLNLHFPLLCPPSRNWFACSRGKVSRDSCDVAVNAISWWRRARVQSPQR